MRTYCEYVSRAPVLGVTLVIGLLLLGVVFPALPIGGEMLDVRPGYTYDEVIAALDGYGAQGRGVYAWASATLDTVLPVIYVSFLAGLIYRFRPTERLWWLASLPVAAGVLDLGENVQIIHMLLHYPDISAGQVARASVFTVSKGYAVTVCLALAGLLLARAAGSHVVHRVRGRNR